MEKAARTLSLLRTISVLPLQSPLLRRRVLQFRSGSLQTGVTATNSNVGPAPETVAALAPVSGGGSLPHLDDAQAQAHAAAEEAHINETLAKLPADSTPEQKANAVGARPLALPAPRNEGADDLQRVRGVGPVNEKHLHDLGIFHFDQIAAWTRAEIRWVGTYLAFPGRVDREQWTAQAANLAHGGTGPKDGHVHTHLDAKPEA